MENAEGDLSTSLPLGDAKQDKIGNLVVILLGANESAPIIGRQRFVNTFFRVCVQCFDEEFSIAEFFPDQYGPDSIVFRIQTNLQIDRGIVLSKKKNRKWEYRLSEAGKKLYVGLSQTLPDNIKVKTSQIKEELSNKSTETILSEVCRDYPQFTNNTIQKDLATAELHKTGSEKTGDEQRNEEELESNVHSGLVDTSYPLFYKELMSKAEEEREEMEIQQLSQLQDLLRNRLSSLKHVISKFENDKEGRNNQFSLYLEALPWLLTPYQFVFSDKKLLNKVKTSLMELYGYRSRGFPDIILRYGSTAMGDLFFVVKAEDKQFTLRDLYHLEAYCITLENILRDQGNSHAQIKGVLMGSSVDIECKEELNNINTYLFVYAENLLEEVEQALSSLLSNLENETCQ